MEHTAEAFRTAPGGPRGRSDAAPRSPSAPDIAIPDGAQPDGKKPDGVKRGLAADEVANLAHELRTPLSAIYSMAELMAEAQFGPIGDHRYESYVAGIRDTARHMLHVIEGMLSGHDALGLDASDLDSLGLDRAGRGTADVTAIANEVHQALWTMAGKAGVALDLTLEPEMLPVRADRTAIAQILFNLVSNAIRHSGAGAMATIRSGIDADGCCWLEVEDDGPGLPLEDGNSVALSHLAHPRESPGRPRHGLGLPLTQKLAGDNGARLAFHAVHPHGTRARITFGQQVGGQQVGGQQVGGQQVAGQHVGGQTAGLE